MTSRFWLPIVFGLGVFAFILILIVAILISVANARERNEIEGTYFASQTSGDVNGNTYEVLDFVSVVQLHNGFQVDALTNFFNGHICSFSGVMQRVTENRLLYDGTVAFPKHDCVLGMTWEDEKLVFDAKGCRDLCGSRGSFKGATFPLRSAENLPMDKLSDEDICKMVIGPDFRIKDMSEVAQAVLFARGIDLLECRQF